nr:integrase, catalytic region, zinc finger, CCHC-type, peptidase aspartic, catalytic [Tanacetum cinerariifolium]
MGTLRETLTERIEGLPKDIYTLINHYIDAKDIWDNVKMILECLELTKEDRESQLPPSKELHSAQATTELIILQRQDVADVSSENRVALDEEQLLFITGGQENAVNEDVDEQHVQDLALNVENVFQAAGPSYDSDILSEVHNHDHYQDTICEYYEVHEMHDDVHPNYGVDSHANYMSDNNMIPYDQYVKDNAVPVVQSNVFAVPNDAYMMILNDIYESPAQHVSVTTQNNVIDKSLTAKLATYKEQVELYERRAIFKLTKREKD